MNEIAYRINSEETLKQGYLVLDFLEVKKEGSSYRIVSIKPEDRSLSQWRALAQHPVDKEIFAFILKEELLFQQKATGRVPSIDALNVRQLHVSSLQVIPLFKLLASTQKLYCHDKALVIDLFGQADFYYEVTRLDQERIEIKGHLRWRDVDIALNDCEAIGPGKPLWFVRGLSLKTIRTTISWKKLLEVRKAPLILEGYAKQTFLEEFEPEDPDTPQFIIK